MLRLSGGDGSLAPTLGSEPDLGTAFALATSLFGNNEVRFSGNVGYASTSGAPTAGFRTSYSREGEGLSPSPEVEVTVRQAALRQAGAGFVHGRGAPVETPVLRTMSVRVGDRMELAPGLQLTYGTMLESVVFIDRLNLLSPYAKLTWDLGEAGVLEGGFASGAPAYELIAGDKSFEDSSPGWRCSRGFRCGAGPRVQKTQSFEIGYREELGGTDFCGRILSGRPAGRGAGGLGQRVPGASEAAAGSGLLELHFQHRRLPQFRLHGLRDAAALGRLVGRFRRGGRFDAGLRRGHAGTECFHRAGRRAPGEAAVGLAADFRPDPRLRHAFRDHLPVDFPPGTTGPSHAFLTQRWQPQLGLNVQIRQPLPVTAGPGRLEMSAELRNLLAQGYLPITSPDGRRLWLVQMPRAVRGGISFIF